MGIVQYGSSSEESEETHASKSDLPVTAPGRAVPTRKRPLPGLPTSYASGAGPRDDPALHQGRKRTRPYVHGDYDAHVYISLHVPEPLYVTLSDIVEILNREPDSPIAHPIVTSDSRDLHISLSHPFPLRRSQIPNFKAELRDRLSKADLPAAFRLSLAGESKIYYNGNRHGGEGMGGRAFLALRVGAGTPEIDQLVNRVLHPVLAKFHRQLHHSNPEYHASFAWALSSEHGDRHSQQSVTNAESGGSFPNEALQLINTGYSSKIVSAQCREGWLVDAITLKIGKEVTVIELRDSKRSWRASLH